MPRSLTTIALLVALAVHAPAAPAGIGAFRLDALLGLQTLSEDDMDATYGTPLFGNLALSTRVAERTRLGLGVGYLRRTGDPYHDDPGLAADLARVTAIPVSLSMEADITEGDGLDVVVGLAFHVAHIEERLPSGDSAERLITESDWGYGVTLSLGPRWSLGAGRHIVGVDLAVGGMAGEVGSNYLTREVDLRGFQVRLAYSIALGNKEATP